MCTKCLFQMGRILFLLTKRRKPRNTKFMNVIIATKHDKSTLNRHNKQHSVKSNENKLVVNQNFIMFAQTISMKKVSDPTFRYL